MTCLQLASLGLDNGQPWEHVVDLLKSIASVAVRVVISQGLNQHAPPSAPEPQTSGREEIPDLTRRHEQISAPVDRCATNTLLYLR